MNALECYSPPSELIGVTLDGNSVCIRWKAVMRMGPPNSLVTITTTVPMLITHKEFQIAFTETSEENREGIIRKFPYACRGLMMAKRERELLALVML